MVAEAARLTEDRAGGRRFLGQHLADMVRIAATDPSLARHLIDAADRSATRYRLTTSTVTAVVVEATGDPTAPPPSTPTPPPAGAPRARSWSTPSPCSAGAAAWPALAT